MTQNIRKKMKLIDRSRVQPLVVLVSPGRIATAKEVSKLLADFSDLTQTLKGKMTHNGTT